VDHPARLRYEGGMADRTAPPARDGSPGKPPARLERLAAALRANLARRKAQARAQARAEALPADRPADAEED
jgi:hypothetical protein